MKKIFLLRMKNLFSSILFKLFLAVVITFAIAFPIGWLTRPQSDSSTPITAYSRNSSSGTYDAFARSVGFSDYGTGPQQLANESQMFGQIRGSTNAIGYSSVSSLEGDDSVKSISINKNNSSDDNENNDTGQFFQPKSSEYKLSRNFNVVLNFDSTLSTKTHVINKIFFEWILFGKTSREIIDNVVGFVPELPDGLIEPIEDTVFAQTAKNNGWSYDDSDLIIKGSTSVQTVLTSLHESFKKIETSTPGEKIFSSVKWVKDLSGSGDAYKSDFLGFQSREPKVNLEKSKDGIFYSDLSDENNDTYKYNSYVQINSSSIRLNRYKSFAIDKIAVIANTDAPINALTTSQLKVLFTRNFSDKKITWESLQSF